MNYQNDRRTRLRFDHGNLSVKVKRAGISGIFGKSKIVNWKDFNKYGMAFESRHRFNLDSKITLQLCIKDEKEFNISNITGVVKNIGKYSDNFRCGVEFAYNSNEFMKSENVKQTLFEIEQLLNSILLRLGKNNGSQIMRRKL